MIYHRERDTAATYWHDQAVAARKRSAVAFCLGIACGLFGVLVFVLVVA